MRYCNYSILTSLLIAIWVIGVSALNAEVAREYRFLSKMHLYVIQAGELYMFGLGIVQLLLLLTLVLLACATYATVTKFSWARVAEGQLQVAVPGEYGIKSECEIGEARYLPTRGYRGACGNEQRSKAQNLHQLQPPGCRMAQTPASTPEALVRDADVDLWDDTRLKAGDKWRQEIKDAITTPKVAIFLISANFYASDFIATEELPALLHADINFGTELIPVLISASRFQRDKILSEFQAINSTPLAELERPMQEKILDQVAQRVEQLLNP